MTLSSPRYRPQGPGADWRKLFGGFAALLLLVNFGCGRKAPPVAPQLVAPVAVADLGAEVVQCTVTLTWSVPPGFLASLPDGYRVYRARVAVEDCEGCPLLFQRIGEVALHKTARPAPGQPWLLTWQDQLTEGFRYVYKVSAYGNGHENPDSNLVTVQP